MFVSSHRRVIAGVIGITALVLACDDKGNDSRELGSTIFTTAEALENAQARFIEPYTEIVQSLEAMKPDIEAVLFDVRASAANAQSTTCLPQDVGGWEYAFSGTEYEKSEPRYVSEIIPETLARFRLYELGSGDVPKLNRMIGYLEVICESDDPQFRAVRVLDNNMEPIQTVTYTPGDNLIDGSCINQTASDTLPVSGELQTSGAVAFKYVIGKLTARAVYPVPWGANSLSVVTINSLPFDSWGIVVEVEVDSSEQIQRGHVYWADPMEDPMLAGCIAGGTVDVPTITSPSAECQTGINIYQTSASERTAIRNIYRTMRLFWKRDRIAAALCRSL